MNFLDSNILSALVGGTVAIGGQFLLKLAFPGKENAETRLLNKDAIHKDLDFVRTERDRYQQLWQQSEITVAALKQRDTEKEQLWTDRFKKLEDRCQHLEEELAQLRMKK